jgi:hypothetical protein
VAEAQRANSNQIPVNTNTPILSNLSMDGKAWFIHPVAMLNYFKIMSQRTTFDRKYIPKDNEVYINVIAPKERNLQGPLIVFDKHNILFKTHSLCRGTNRDRLKANGKGDTPTGLATTYYAPKRHNNKYSYGNYGLIYLNGKAGEFLIATKNGRSGIAIHCGHTTGYYNKSFEDLSCLMNTHGCIRIYNQAMRELGNLYEKLTKQGKTIYCYIEDYDGNIKDVYMHYGFDSDPKDVKRNKESKRQ